MAISEPDAPIATEPARTPSVLAVVVVRDGVPWLRDCLRALAQQTYPRLGVLAVHNGWMDGRRELLEQALGAGRVLEDPRDEGAAGALRLLRGHAAAEAADYLLLLHDDTSLAPDAVARLVETAELTGVGRIGVVGPKIVDWEDPRILREVGATADGFGHREVSLQEGERDQGQYDRVIEVLAVPSCAMLLSNSLWREVDPFDERYEGHAEDVDFCWRARLAGFRVLMTPLALARHAAPPGRGERSDQRRHGRRYFAERSALSTMLKDYGLLNLLLNLPAYLVFSLFRIALLGITRRFEDALDIASAIGWNARHLPGTLVRRRRAQAKRTVKDPVVRRFMLSPFRVPRWFERAEELLEEQLEEESLPEGDEEVARPGFGRRAVSGAVGHPVLVAIVLGVVTLWLGLRELRSTSVLTGGALAPFPVGAAGFLGEFLAPVRTTLLGGADAPSPALAFLGTLSWLTFGSGPVAQRLLLALLLPAAGVTAYRALRRQEVGPSQAVLGAASYVASGALLWAFSDGRLPLLVLAVVLPIAWERLETMAVASETDTRTAVGLGMSIAFALMFLPGSLLALAVLFVLHVLLRRRDAAAFRAVGLALIAALALAFPVVIGAIWAPSSTLGSIVGTTQPGQLLRLAAGVGPGTGWSAYFLPVVAVLGSALVGPELRERSSRALGTALVAVVLAWASAVRFLPSPIANAPVYLVVAAFATSAVVAYALTSIVGNVASRGFGGRQILAGLVTLVLFLGLAAQALQFAVGDWGIGRDRRPAAWPLISSESGDFRILWLGTPDARPFPAPGGDPQGVIAAGEASVRYALTGRDGALALDFGRGAHGPGYDYLEAAIAELLAGRTQHVGALFAPLGIRFVVAAEGDLPGEVVRRMGAQSDLDLVPAGGLEIFRNARALPVASIVRGPAFALAVGEAGMQDIAALPPLVRREIRRSGVGWEGESAGGTAFLSVQDDGGWNDREVDGDTAFGWAVSFEAPAGRFVARHGVEPLRVGELALLALFWLAALWATRRPVST